MDQFTQAAATLQAAVLSDAINTDAAEAKATLDQAQHAFAAATPEPPAATTTTQILAAHQEGVRPDGTPTVTRFVVADGTDEMTILVQLPSNAWGTTTGRYADIADRYLAEMHGEAEVGALWYAVGRTLRPATITRIFTDVSETPGVDDTDFVAVTDSATGEFLTGFTA